MKKNKEFRKLIAGTGIGILVLLLFLNVIIYTCQKKLAAESYGMAASLLGAVKEQYPEFDEEAWIVSLNETEAETDGTAILKQYGMFQKQFVNSRQEKLFEQLVIALHVVFLAAILFLVRAFWGYLNRRQNSLEQLTEYVKRVERGDYSLELIENTEDELSSLKNELYTVTVMLKEHADISQKHKRALADSVSDISHQLKTPLTSIMILLDNLSEDENMPLETRKRFLTEITNQLKHVNWLVATLLKLSRLDAGVVDFSMTKLSLDELLYHVTDELEVMAEWKQIVLQVKGDDGIEITADEHWIREAIKNIVKNAIEHSPVGGEVLLQKEDNTVYTAISVTDCGEGMSREECKHIFERFYRSRGAKEDSIGIGLSLAKEIVTQHGGSISVESKKGCGTTFKIKLLKK